MNFYKITIAQRLAFGFSLVTLITLLLGIYAIKEFKNNSSIIKNMFNHSYAVSNAVKDIHTDIMSINASVFSMMIHEDKDFVNKQCMRINIDDKNIHKQFSVVRKKYLGSISDVQHAYDTYKKIIPIRTQMINLIKEKKIEESKILMRTKAYSLIQSLHNEIHILSQKTDKTANDFFIATQEKEKDTTNLLILALIFVIILSSIIAITIIKSIVNPLNVLIKISDKINKGDFSALNNKDDIYLKNRPDQLGKLYDSFHTLLSCLLLPYDNIIKGNKSLLEITDEVRRLLDAFDKNVIASKIDTQGKLIYVSKAFLDISGYSLEELLERKHNIIYHADMPDSLIQNIWDTITQGKVWTGEIKKKKKDGSFFWIKTNITPDTDRNGHIHGYNIIQENITAEKALEELSHTLEDRVALEIKKNNEKTGFMLQQSRLAQMGEMISMIAHQWRQPLSSISAISGTLTLDIMMDNYNAKFFESKLESISELAQHLSSTIDDFRGFFKENKEEHIANIETVIYESISIIAQTLKTKNIELMVNSTNNVKIKSHINEIKQVFLNVLKNAEDILLEKQIEKANIWVNIFTKDSYVHINIEDNAGGVPEDIMDKVFDPYFSTKKEKDGTGLGLYMSKTIIEEHCRGKLLLENTKEGASFTIMLPIFYEEINYNI